MKQTKMFSLRNICPGKGSNSTEIVQTVSGQYGTVLAVRKETRNGQCNCTVQNPPGKKSNMQQKIIQHSSWL